MTQARRGSVRIRDLAEAAKDERRAVGACQSDVGIEFPIARQPHTDPALIRRVAGFDVDRLSDVVVAGGKVDRAPKGIVAWNADVYRRFYCLLNERGIICSA